MILLGASTWLGFSLAPWAALLPFVAAGGVLLYAARPRGARPRPKDVLVAKSLYIALGITGFAALATIAAHPAAGSLEGSRSIVVARPLGLTLAILQMVIRVFADAVLCDLDDERADRAFGTRTLPGRFGRRPAWNFGFLLRLALAGALLIASFSPGGLPPFTLQCWAAVTAASSIALRWIAPAKVRDWVDARFAAEAAIVSLILACRSTP